MFRSVLFCLASVALAVEIIPGFETSRFGLNFNLCPPPLPPKIVYLPAPCRFDVEQEEIRLALARLDANMGQAEVYPAADPAKTNELGDGAYDSSSSRDTVSKAAWSLL